MSPLKIPSLFFLSAFLLFTTAICPAQSASHTLTVRGRVVDQNNASIFGAVISAESNGAPKAATAVSDKNGEFALALFPGSYQLTIAADGFAESSQALNVEPERELGTIKVTLDVAASSATVTITDTVGYQVAALMSATKTVTSLRDIPQSIAVVTKDQIADQSFRSIADVVTYVPGVVSHQGENNRDQLVIRGNSTSADFFLNGVRDDVQYYRDLYNVERVEVLKGPNAMVFGRGGGGGVVNRISKEAGFAPMREMRFQAGSFGNKRLTADFNQPFSDKVAFRVNGLFEDSDSFRKYVGLRRYAINPNLVIAAGSQTTVSLSYEHLHDGRVADRGIPSFAGRPADVAVSTFFGNPKQSRVRSNVNITAAALEHHVGGVTIRNRTSLGYYDRFYQNFVPGAVNANKTRVAISAYSNATKRRNLFNQTDLIYSFGTGRMRHTFLAGAEFGRQLTDNLRHTGFFNNNSTSISVPYLNPLVTTEVTFRQNATDANNQVTANLGATYLQDQLELSKSFQVVAGVRFDYFDLQFDNHRTGDRLRRIDRLVSPRAGVVFKPIDPVSLYANYSISYLPSSGDQFSSLTVITQQVKPEKFDNYEVGAKWDARRNLFLTAALYRLVRKNTRATDPLDPTRILQTGSQRTKGFEFGLNGSVNRDWRIVGGYAYQDAVITSATTTARAGARVAQVPRHTFSLWNNYQLNPKLSVGLGLVHRSDMYAAIDNTVTLPGYTKIDAAVYYSLAEKWRLQANLENLFNRKYYINADGNNNISPGMPRAVRLAVITTF